MTFEIVAIILTDKGFTKLVGLTRLRLVEGVTGQVLDFFRYARLTHVGIKTIEDVGSRITGDTQRRWSEPLVILGTMGNEDDYADPGCIGDGSLACPSLVTYQDERWVVHTNLAQWERLAGFGYLDAIVPLGTNLPDGTLRDVSVPEVVALALFAAEESPVHNNESNLFLPEFTDGLQRVFIPGDSDFSVPQSTLYSTVQERIAQLEQHLETPLHDALKLTADYWNLSPLERLPYLDSLLEEVTSIEHADTADLDLLDYL